MLAIVARLTTEALPEDVKVYIQPDCGTSGVKNRVTVLVHTSRAYRKESFWAGEIFPKFINSQKISATWGNWSINFGR